MTQRPMRNLVVGLGVAYVALIVAALLSYMAKSSLKKDSEWVFHTHEVLTRLAAFRSSLTEIETAERGYIATGDKEFIAQVDQAENSVWQAHNELVVLTQDNPAQQKALKDLHAITSQKILFADRVVGMRATGDGAGALAMVASKQGKRQMDAVYRILDDLTGEETRLRQERIVRANRSDHRTTLLILVSFGLAGLVGLITLAIFERDRRTRLAAAKEALAFADLIKGVFNSSLSGILVMHAVPGKDDKPKDYTIKAVNELALTLMQRQGQHILDKTLLEVTENSQGAQALMTIYTEVYLSGVAREWPISAVMPNGETRWFQIACVSVAQGVAVSFTDITERRLANQTIERQKQLLDGVLANMPVIILSYLRDGTITRSLGSGVKTIGVEEGQLVGENIYKLWPNHATELKQVFRDKKMRMTGMSADPASEYYFDTYFFIDEHNPDQVIGFALDVTTARIAEHEITSAMARAEQASDAKTRFLANMSHEIRTPLSAILGFAEVMRLENTSSVHAEYLEHISSAGTTLLKLIGDILDLTKIEEGKMALSPERFHVTELLSSVIHPYAFRAQEKGLSFNLTFGQQLPAYAFADAGKVCQVIINLLGNALKFTQAGKIEVRIEGDEPDEDGKFRLTISITDSGIGVPEDKLEQIFGAFTQADVGISRKFGGSGLGLSIVKEMVHLLGGEIFVESPAYPEQAAGAGHSAGPGTRFIFWVPLTVDADQRNDLGPALATNQAIPADIRVLMAEDNVVNQRLAYLILRGAGVHVDMADNGQIALELARKHAYALIFMDVQMPVLDGLASTRAIRLHDPYIPIIGLSANVYKEDVDECFNAGMTDFLAKPYNKDRILDKVRHYAAHADKSIAQAILPKMTALQAPPPPPAEAPAKIDPLVGLRNLTEGAPEEMRSILLAYLEVQDEFLAAVQRYNGDAYANDHPAAQAMGAAAHKLKGTIMLIGLPELLPMLQELEDKVRYGGAPAELRAIAASINAGCLNHLPVLEGELAALA